MRLRRALALAARRLWRVLVSRGEACGRHRVARLRRQHGVITRRRRRFLRGRASYQGMPAAPNRLAWPFASPAPNRVWVGDITHVPTREGWLYLATVLDVCSRRVVGWAMASRQTFDLAERALHMAIVQRRPPPQVVLHHDRGSQYTSASYRAKAEAANMLLSMSRPGMPYDNAMAESFFGTLRLELMPDQVFRRVKPHDWRCSTTSRPSTIERACTRRSATNHPLNTRSGSIAWGMCPRSTLTPVSAVSAVSAVSVSLDPEALAAGARAV